MHPKLALTSKQEQAAIDAVTSMDWTPIMSPLPARAVAEAISVSEEQAEEILSDLSARGFIELRFEHPANNLLETGEVVLNRRSRWFRLKT